MHKDRVQIMCQSPKYENGFKHLWHLASGRAMNTSNDENLRFFFIRLSRLVTPYNIV